MLRRRLMMLAQNLFRWIRTKDIMAFGRKALLNSGHGKSTHAARALRQGRRTSGQRDPAEIAAAERAAQTGRYASGQDAPSESTAAARAMRLGRMCLNAYNVCLITLLKGLHIARLMDAERADGADGILRRVTQMAEKATGERAEAEETEAQRVMQAARRAGADGYPAEPFQTARQMTLGREVQPDDAPSEMYAAQRATRMGKTVAAMTWISPEWIGDGILLIRQAYKAELNDTVLEVG